MAYSVTLTYTCARALPVYVRAPVLCVCGVCVQRVHGGQCEEADVQEQGSRICSQRAPSNPCTHLQLTVPAASESLRRSTSLCIRRPATALGLVVGFAVGPVVGMEVGENVGLAVGLAVGEDIGLVEGLLVGLNDGLADGDALVGKAEGDAEGDAEGELVVGAVLGLALGLAVGCVVGLVHVPPPKQGKDAHSSTSIAQTPLTHLAHASASRSANV